MIKASNATLQVKHRHGRYGTFSVADLITDFGQFKVKDALLDQFEEGNYQANVWIDEIYLGYYSAYGRGVNEIRARLHDLQVLDEDQRPAEPEQDIDPIEEAQAQAQAVAAVAQPQQAETQPDADVSQDVQPKAAAQTASAPDTDKRQAKVSRWDKFKRKAKDAAPEQAAQAVQPEAGSIYDDDALAAIETLQPVKLDPTVDRALLRQQTAGLKKLGYKFNSREQMWFAAETSTAEVPA